jgi:hypothetical protein
MQDIALNLWDANEYGDGTHKGVMLTAYQVVDGHLDSSNYVSVQLRTLDVPKGYVVDDDWAYPGSSKFTAWMQLFIAKQLENNKEKTNA